MEVQSSTVLLAVGSAFGLWLIWTVATLQRDLSRLKRRILELEDSKPVDLKAQEFHEVLPRRSADSKTEVEALAASMVAEKKSDELFAEPSPGHTDPLPEVESLPEIELPIDEAKLGEIDFASVLDSEEDSHPTLIKDLNPKKNH